MTERDSHTPRIERVTHRLVKWDGEAPPGGIPDDASIHPEKYPQVAEVIESSEGLQGPKVVYRRS